MKIVDKNFLIVIGCDALLTAASWYGAHLLRFNFQLPDASMGLVFRTLPIIVILKLVIFYLFDLYQGMWRYTSLNDLFNIIKATLLSSLIILVMILFTFRFVGVSRSVLIIDWVLTTIFISTDRLAIRLFFRMFNKRKGLSGLADWFVKTSKNARGRAKRLLIIGAGDSGEKIYREIRDNARLPDIPIAHYP